MRSWQIHFEKLGQFYNLDTMNETMEGLIALSCLLDMPGYPAPMPNDTEQCSNLET